MIKLFVDESGTHEGSPIVSVAGYMARGLKWQKFTTEWRRVLKPRGIEIFHATDCAALRGEFQGWTPENRDKLVRSLLPIIPKYAFGYAVAVKLNEVDKLLEHRPDLRKFHKDPYAACFQWMLMSVLNDLREMATEPRPISVIHEFNDFRDSATAAFETVRASRGGEAYVSLTFARKQDFVPLQAADTLAYEAAKRILHQDGPERRSLTALKADGRVSLKSINRNNANAYVDMLSKIKDAYDRGILADAARYDR